MPPAVKRNRGVFDLFIGGGRSAGQKTGAHPIDQIVGGDMIGRAEDHAAAPAGANPVLRQRDALCGSRAGGVDLRVGTASADEFGKLRMSRSEEHTSELQSLTNLVCR